MEDRETCDDPPGSAPTSGFDDASTGPMAPGEKTPTLSNPADEDGTDPGLGRERPAIDPDAFLQTLQRLGLIDAAEADLRRRSPGEAADPRALDRLAESWIASGRITRFQAEAVRRGDGDRLILGNYLLVGRLGAGGMGEVYKAVHRRLKRVAALKRLPESVASHPAALLRFQRESEVMARLNHPNVVAVYDAGESAGHPYLVMEFLEGDDLWRRVQDRGPMAVDEAVDAVIQAARGVGAAHDRGIIHRDIKPSNLLMDASGIVKVLDLGLARVVEEADRSTIEGLTQDGVVMGTPGYMAPEQIDDSRQADHRSDVYSLGCTLHFLLTGSPPYPAPTTTERLLAHTRRPIPSLRQARSDVPEALDLAFTRMLAKAPEDRLQTMADVIALLEGIAPTGRAIDPGRKEGVVSTDPPPGRFPIRVPLLLGAVLVVALLAAGRFALLGRRASEVVTRSPGPARTVTRPGLFSALLDARNEELTAWCTRVAELKMMPIQISGHDVAGSPRFAAVALPNPDNLEWAARRVPVDVPFQTHFDDMLGNRWWPLSISLFDVQGQASGSSLWIDEKVLADRKHYCWSDIPPKEFLAKCDEGDAERRLVYLSARPSGEEVLFSGLWTTDPVPVAGKVMKIDLTAERFAEFLAEKKGQGFRPTSATAYRSGETTLFGVTMVNDGDARPWDVEFGLSTDALAQALERRGDDRVIPLEITGYREGGRSRYLVIWCREVPGKPVKEGLRLPPRSAAPPLDPAAVPSTGSTRPELASLDDLIRRFVAEHGGPGAALAVAKDGRLVYARGFGLADRETKEPVHPDSLFRIASVSKPVTASAVMLLAQRGKLQLDDLAIDVLKRRPGPNPEAPIPPGWRKVTIRDLLQHTSGWDPDRDDPAVEAVLRERGTFPAPPETAVRAMIGRPPSLEPGQVHRYANANYQMLGRVIEAASGQSYEAFVRQDVLAPLGIGRMRLGGSRPADRLPGEVRYLDGLDLGAGPDVAAEGRPVPRPYDVEMPSIDSSGGWVASAVDLVRLASAMAPAARDRVLSPETVRRMVARPAGPAGFGDDGQPLTVFFAAGWQVTALDPEPVRFNLWHDGMLPGSEALLVLRADGIALALLFNARDDRPGESLRFSIDDPLHQAINNVTTWPEIDLFPAYGIGK